MANLLGALRRGHRPDACPGPLGRSLVLGAILLWPPELRRNLPARGALDSCRGKWDIRPPNPSPGIETIQRIDVAVPTAPIPTPRLILVLLPLLFAAGLP